MSSFKRKSAAKQTSSLLGTRRSQASSSTIITSTGIPSLDDILGGGLPLSCSLLTLAPDAHSSYGQLLQKYFVAQGLASGQDVCVIADDAREFVGECKWVPGKSLDVASAPREDGEEGQTPSDEKIVIAWRYEKMKQFQTTSNAFDNNFCQSFDLTSRIPDSQIEDALRLRQLRLLDVHDTDLTEVRTISVLRRISELVEETRGARAQSIPLRICIPSLGSPMCGDLDPKQILHFLHSLRSLLRRNSHVCASLSLPSFMSTDSWGGPGWTQKLGWLCDGMITLSAFTANPSLSATFPSYHGLLSIQTLPSPHTLVAPSDRFSTLRGLASAAGSSGGSGENNLAFKCTRKRFIFETLHLDLEGGVSERRTTPAIVVEVGAATAHDGANVAKTARASVQIELEGASSTVSVQSKAEDTDPPATSKPTKSPKAKRKVAFQSDRPDVFDY